MVKHISFIYGDEEYLKFDSYTRKIKNISEIQTYILHLKCIYLYKQCHTLLQCK